MTRNKKGFPKSPRPYAVIIHPQASKGGTEDLNHQEGWDTYHAKSKSVSDIMRQLTLAGVVLIWAFHDNVPNVGPSLPRTLSWAAVALVVTMILDVLQYLVLTVRFRVRIGKCKRENIRYAVPDGIATPSEWIFWGKVVTAVIGWSCIFVFLFLRLRFG